MKQILNKKLLFRLLLGQTFLGFTAYAMEENKGSLDEVPAYCCYKRTPIEQSTIGQLALSYPLQQEESMVVKEWRDQNKNLLVALFDFNYKNSEWRAKKKEDLSLLKAAELENKSEWSYIFKVPKKNDLWVQITGPLHRVCNTKAHHKLYEKQLNPMEFDSLKKPEKTFQTVSRYIHFLKYLEADELHNFNHFRVPETYLIPLVDDQPTEHYSDDNSFVVQRTLSGNPVPLRHNKQRICDITPQSFKELLIAIKEVGLWDTNANLLIDDENNLCMTDLEQPNHENPDNFFNKDLLYYSHKPLCGLHQLYQLCEGHNELQRHIQDFARNEINLPYENKQKELVQLLKLNEKSYINS